MHLFYISTFLDPDIGPQSLARKVQWDICYYFTRRGRENFHIMTEDWFGVIVDDNTGLECVIKLVDEETKNHKSIDNEIVSGRMPSMNGNIYCPVTSFKKYMKHLSPKSNSLWQTPKFNKNSQVTERNPLWYFGHLSHNKLDSFVSDIAYACGVQRGTYSNHSLSHTAITSLKKAKFGDKQFLDTNLQTV